MRNQIEISTNPAPLTYFSPDSGKGAAPDYSALAHQIVEREMRERQNYYNSGICTALRE